MRTFHQAILLLLLVASLALSCHAQAPVLLAPLPQLQFFDQSGRPLSFGCVFTYQSNSTTPLATYTDYTGNTLNANPVVLSAGGSANIWIQAGQSYAFRVKASGGTNCASGATLYTVNGIGGGVSIVTTVVPYSPTPTFNVTGQNQLFEITLTGNATSQPLNAVGIQSPGIIFFQITQDGTGGHTFTWPANVIGGAPIGLTANQITTQEFVWNGFTATAVGPAVTGSGPLLSGGSLSLSGSQYANGFQGSAGTKLATTAGSWSTNVSLCSNSTLDTVPCPSNVLVANASSTGTTINTLTKLTGAPSTAVITATSDIGGALGITTAGAGTTGNALIQQQGIASCVFDGATTAGDLVGISSMTAGNCHDTGVAPPNTPSSGQIVGQVFSTNASGGTYAMVLTPIFTSVVKHAHATSVTVPEMNSESTTMTWSGGAFADTNYSFSCTLWTNTSGLPGNANQIYGMGADVKIAASVNYVIQNTTSGDLVVNIDCLAVHD